MKQYQVIKILIGISVFFLFTFCYSQNDKKILNESIYGKWKCVKHDYGGFSSFTLEQAEDIRNSTLNIEKNRIYYGNNSFVGICNFSKFNITKYDTIGHLGLIIEFRYKKKELSKILVFQPLDENGKFSCYNDCAKFYLKQDTLINICGGYTFFLIKIK